MPQDYGFDAMVEFLEYAGEHGLINLSTTRGYRAAASKIQEELTEQETADVRQLDLDAVFQRLTNRGKIKVSPATLREYKRRLNRSITEFVEWREDPTAYKPKGARKARSNGKTAAHSSTTADKAAPRGDRHASTEASASSKHGILNLPYPLRPDFLAHVQVPRDLNSEEAERLAAFVRTLATDFKPEG